MTVNTIVSGGCIVSGSHVRQLGAVLQRARPLVLQHRAGGGAARRDDRAQLPPAQGGDRPRLRAARRPGGRRGRRPPTPQRFERTEGGVVLITREMLAAWKPATGDAVGRDARAARRRRDLPAAQDRRPGRRARRPAGGAGARRRRRARAAAGVPGARAGAARRREVVPRVQPPWGGAPATLLRGRLDAPALRRRADLPAAARRAVRPRPATPTATPSGAALRRQPPPLRAARPGRRAPGRGRSTPTGCRRCVHGHDWHAGLAPAYLRASRARGRRAARPACSRSTTWPTRALFAPPVLRRAGPAGRRLHAARRRVPRPGVVHEGGAALRRPHHHREPDLRARDPGRRTRLRPRRPAARAPRGAVAASSTASTTRCGTRPPTRDRAHATTPDDMAGKARLQGRAAARVRPRRRRPTRRCSPWSAA